MRGGGFETETFVDLVDSTTNEPRAHALVVPPSIFHLNSNVSIEKPMKVDDDDKTLGTQRVQNLEQGESRDAKNIPLEGQRCQCHNSASL